jgi:hypothetical protein
MKFIRPKKSARQGDSFVFSMTLGEKELLLTTLKMYPMLDSKYHRLSRDPKATTKAEQEWLVEAMEQQQQEHKKRLEQLLADNQRFFRDDSGTLALTLTSEQMEWMLRVLNEIRVGSWARLGCPDPDAVRPAKMGAGQAHFAASMELSGYFQSILLEAFS